MIGTEINKLLSVSKGLLNFASEILALVVNIWSLNLRISSIF